MEKEFSAPLHYTQFGNHLEYKQKVPTGINPEVKELVDQGYGIRTAYQIVEKKRKTAKKVKTNHFDYDANTPKGEWV